MRVPVAMLLLVLVGPAASPALAAETTEKHKADANQGMTFEDIGRGLKSAAKNIGDEIPKIGPAIADTFKKVTGSDKEKEKDSDSSSKKKPAAQNTASKEKK